MPGLLRYRCSTRCCLRPRGLVSRSPVTRTHAWPARQVNTIGSHPIFPVLGATCQIQGTHPSPRRTPTANNTVVPGGWINLTRKGFSDVHGSDISIPFRLRLRAWLTYLTPYGVSGFGRIVEIGKKPRLFSVCELAVFYKLERNQGILFCRLPAESQNYNVLNKSEFFELALWPSSSLLPVLFRENIFGKLQYVFIRVSLALLTASCNRHDIAPITFLHDRRLPRYRSGGRSLL
jgi:hypothetical protein